ncbi:HrpF/NolX family T3SS translocon protein [Rhizobacter sp. OV335]|uniref:HrpF/NolX family T3SS translocon protein n=1 Tax=Rhizobacter sp. OV335 TaxID=1500264 RepID=UPI0009207184|nr:HrpF/NolX family T3SS translocon protein [Rhizobacter sp. OV335]SHN21843.1 NolX protein [Rhizobacter sp. OV335]
MNMMVDNKAWLRGRIGTVVPHGKLGGTPQGDDPMQQLAQSTMGQLPPLSLPGGDDEDGEGGGAQLLKGMIGAVQQGGAQQAQARQKAAAQQQPQQQQQQPVSPEQKYARMEALSTLERHEGSFSKHGTKISDMEKMAKDEKTPPDLRKALNTVLSDTGPDNLRDKLDGAKNGKLDHKISSKDIQKLADDPELKAYNEEKAKGYADNYIPSGDNGKTTEGRPITKNDAENELYKFADYLPKNMSLDELHKIVDGSSHTGKCPPQLIAAAKYFADHPQEWKDLNNGKDKVSHASMEDKISAKGQLDADQMKALDRIDADPNGAFGGKFNRDKLKKIADDPKAAPEDKEAAKKFLEDPVLFGKLDNAKHGRDIKGAKKLWQQSDDGTISRDDIKAFRSHLENKEVATTPANATHKPKGAEDVKAVGDMVAGEMDQPDQKKAKGGGFKKFLQGCLSVVSKIANVISKVAEKLGRVLPPPFNLVAKAVAVGSRAWSEGTNVAATAIQGGDVKKALRDAGLDLAGTGLNVVTNSSAGSMVTGAVKTGLNGASGEKPKAADFF